MLSVQSHLAGIIARRSSGVVTGSPPTSATSFGQSSTANFNTFTTGGITTPANTRAVFAGFGSFLEFNVAEPQNITSLTCTYGGQPMTRVDTFDNQFFATRFHLWAFALLSPATIPASGNVVFTLTSSAGSVELQSSVVHMVTHDTDLQLDVLDENRLTATNTTVSNTYSHDANALVLSLTGFKGQGTITGAGGLWIEQRRQQAFDSFADASGTLLLESRQLTTAGVNSITTTSSAANFASGAVYSLRSI